MKWFEALDLIHVDQGLSRRDQRKLFSSRFNQSEAILDQPGDCWLAEDMTLYPPIQ